MCTDKTMIEKASNYLKGGGNTCPFCGSHDIEAFGRLNADSGYAWQDVSCPDCGEVWTDRYMLTNIEHNGIEYDLGEITVQGVWVAPEAWNDVPNDKGVYTGSVGVRTKAWPDAIKLNGESLRFPDMVYRRHCDGHSYWFNQDGRLMACPTVQGKSSSGESNGMDLTGITMVSSFEQEPLGAWDYTEIVVALHQFGAPPIAQGVVVSLKNNFEFVHEGPITEFSHTFETKPTGPYWDSDGILANMEKKGS